MRKPLYLQALKDGWELAWHHKILWVFGLLAAFLGQFGLMELFIKVGLTGSQFGFFPARLVLPQFFQPSFLPMTNFSLPIDDWAGLIWLFCFFLGFAIFLMFVTVSSQGALIQASAQFAKKRTEPDAGAAWRSGTRHFWRLFFLNLIKKLLIAGFAVALGFAIINAVVAPSAWDWILFILLFVLVAIVGMVLSFLMIYAAGYVVVEEYPLWRAIDAAWRLFLDHWLVSLETGVIVLAMNAVLGVVVLASFFWLFLPTLFLWMLAVSLMSSMLYYVAILFGSIVFVLFIALAGAIFTVFTTAVWTDLFIRMHRHGLASRLLHWAGWCK
jgi:hypothetical protein